MADINVSSPSDTGVVANYPADERASRAAILALLSGTAFWGGTSGGSANAQTVSVSNTGLTLTAGLLVVFLAGNGSTSSTPTLQVNSLTAKTVQGAIVADLYHLVAYDGTDFHIVSRETTGAYTEPTVGTDTTAELTTAISPSARRITVAINNLSTNGTSNLLLQLGHSGGYETSGYNAAVSNDNGVDTATTGVRLTRTVTAAGVLRGILVIQLVNRTANTWVITGNLYNTGTDKVESVAANISLAGELTKVQLTTAGGANVFDGGVASVLVE